MKKRKPKLVWSPKFQEYRLDTNFSELSLGQLLRAKILCDEINKRLKQVL